MHLAVSLSILCRYPRWKLDRTYRKCYSFTRIFLFGKKIFQMLRENFYSIDSFLQAVHFALCHIYSGASHPPEGISLMELASLSDLLGLEGLKEVTAYALKINYCHNFHKVCF